MTTATLTQGEDFYRGLFNAATEDHRPVCPVAKMLLIQLTETASHVGAEELKDSKARRWKSLRGPPRGVGTLH